MKALLVIDVQNDFCEEGNLPVTGGNSIVPKINKLITDGNFDVLVATKDHHPSGHVSFASTHNKEVFSNHTLEDGTIQIMWPDHCIQGTKGVEFHPELITDKFDHITYKGEDLNVDSYSGFFDNNKVHKTDLSDFLKSKNVTEVVVVGLALDVCVKFTALDALSEGFKTSVVLEACKAAIDADAAIKELKDAGVQVL